MGKAIDLTSQRFDRLVVVSKTEKRFRGHIVWHCKCDCGNEIDVPAIRLTKKNTRSCGCLLKETASKKGKQKKVDLTNKRFGRLLVLYPTDKRESGFIIWKCKCDCGNETEVSSHNLASGNTISCGCYRIETALEKEHLLREYKKESYIFNTRLDMVKSGRNPNKNSSTGHLGVHKRRKDSKYVAIIRFQKKKYYLGSYYEIEGAIEARKTAENNLYGDFLKWYEEFKKQKRYK